MAIALTRDKRFNAGNRMSRMLQEEEQDDFYKTMYGGFDEHSGDEEYSSSSEDSEASDSDISASEDDDVVSDEDNKDPQRKRRTVTKAYKEPVSKPTTKKTTQTKPKVATKSKDNTPKEETEHLNCAQQEAVTDDPNLRKSSRKSTILKGTEFQIRLAERKERAEMIRISIANRSRPEVRRLTQDELLQEAKITEKRNLISLKTYHKLEAEKKKSRFHKQSLKGPFIRFHSMTMPEVSDEKTDDAGLKTHQPPNITKKCSRNFITFSEVSSYKEYFPQSKNRPPTKPLCPVTRKRAMYLDPITNIPYANKEAFQVIRDAYKTELESQWDNKKRKTQPKVNS